VQFRLPSFADKLVAIAQEEGLPLSRLELEILETSYFEDPVRMRGVLTGLRAQGVKIALDDFGTGYSSLAALMELALDKLKIDAGFVKKFEDIKSASIIHAIVALARAIGLKITAEGVEEARQQSFLRSAGCHYLQGYLFSEPVEASVITGMLKGKGPLPRRARG
jgi:EAL domain-containing protein (putative c-di-GMP-specific phosphodiesterase class I)